MEEKQTKVDPQTEILLPVQSHLEKLRDKGGIRVFHYTGTGGELFFVTPEDAMYDPEALRDFSEEVALVPGVTAHKSNQVETNGELVRFAESKFGDDEQVTLRVYPSAEYVKELVNIFLDRFELESGLRPNLTEIEIALARDSIRKRMDLYPEREIRKSRLDELRTRS